MRILIIGYDFKPNSGGIAEYTYQIAKWSSKFGHECLVMADTPSKGVADYNFNFKVVRCEFSKKRAMSSWQRYKYAYKKINSICKEFNPDFILGNQINPETRMAILIGKKEGIPTGVIVYGQELLGRGFFWFLKRKLFFVWTDLIVSISQYTKGLLKQFGRFDHKTIIIPPGLDMQEWQENIGENIQFLPLSKNELDNNFIMFTLGQLVKRKGFDTTIEALSNITEGHSDYIYLIAGAGPYEKKLKGLVKNYNLEKQVFFLGKITDEQKKLLFKISDVFIMPTRQVDYEDVEGFGIVYLEANAMKTPVIASPAGGVVDAVEDNVSGLFVEPDNPQKCAEILKKIKEDSDLATRLGQNGFERVGNKFDWKNLLKKLESEIKKIIEKKSK